MLNLDECEGRTDVGPKVEVLARARQKGLPIPDGKVVLPDEPPPAPGTFSDLGERFAVRSSALLEDRHGRSAAGLFLSLTAVPAEQLPSAILQVRQSGQGEAVLHYFGHPVPVPVLVQCQVPAARLGVMQLLPDGGALIEERSGSEPEWGAVSRRTLPARDESDLMAGARKLAELLPGSSSVHIEYAIDTAGKTWFLQARPAPPPAEHDPSLWPPPPLPLLYHLDREHNPDPLSAAQASLVEQVEHAGICPALRQCVRRGYLYYAKDESVPPGEVIQPADLPRRFTQEVLPACDALLAPLEARPPEDVPLPTALDTYLSVYRRYVCQIAPSIARARGHLDRLLKTNLGEGLVQHTDLLLGLSTLTLRRTQALWQLGRAQPAPVAGLLSDYLALYGAYSTCWDVAVPCDDEHPERVLATARALAAGPDPEHLRQKADARYHQAMSALLERLPRMARGALKALLPVVRAALVVAEDDDALFFRAQRVLRRALLGRGALLQRQGRLAAAVDIFHLPLSSDNDGGAAMPAPGSRSLESSEADLMSLAAFAARAQDESRRLLPPDHFASGQPVWSLSADPQGGVLRGLGVPGADPAPVRGRARVITSLSADRSDLADPASLDGKVLVLPALLPSWAPFMLRAAALVTDSGGALSHGATLARENGIPAVVGTRRATRQIREGDLVLVDARAGRVYSAQTGSFPGTTNGR